MTPAPINDPREFRAVLADWMARHELTTYGAAKILPITRVAIGKWLDGHPCPAERAHRALMTLYDENRA